MTAISKKVIFCFLLLGLFVGSASAYTSPTEEDLFFRFNESSSPATDYSGNNNDGTWQGTLEPGVPGISKSEGSWGSGEAYEFGETDEYIDAGDFTTIGTGDVSVSAWIKTSDATQDAMIVNKQQGSGSYTGFQFKIKEAINGKLRLRPLDVNNNQVCQVDSPNSLADGNWHHVVGVVDRSSGCRIYVDGTQVNSTSLNSDTDFSNNQPFVVGGRPADSNKHFQGVIDEPKLFDDYALTDSEVSNLYQYNSIENLSGTGSNSAPTLSNPSPSDGSTGVSTTTDLSIDYSDSDGDSGTVTFYWQNGTQIQQLTSVSSGSTASSSSLSLNEGTTYNWYVEASDGNGGSDSAGNYSFTTLTSNSGSGEYSSPASEKMFYRFNGTCPATDYSGNNHDGTCENSPTTGVTGITKTEGIWDTGKAYSFDGSDDRINAGDVVTLGEKSVSASAWIKLNDDGTANHIIAKQAGSGGNFNGFQFKVRGQWNGRIKLQPFDQSGNDICNGLQYGSNYDDGNWHHIVGVVDQAGGECRIYADGDLKNSSTLTTGNMTNSAPLSVGARPIDNAKHTNGTIDEPRFYLGKALTDSEVSNLYQYNQLTVPQDNFAPDINSVEYEVSNSWITSGSLNFGDTVTRIRANITDPEGDTISDTNLTLKDLYDSNTRVSDFDHTSTSSDYFVFDISDQNLDDSGNWETVIEVADNNSNIETSIGSWSLSWGTLSASLDSPSADVRVNQNTTFEMNGTVTCSGGECASEGEVVEIYADPVKREKKITIEGSVTPGDLKDTEFEKEADIQGLIDILRKVISQWI